MNPFLLALLEMRHRWLSTLVLCAVIGLAVATSLAASWLGKSAVRETRRVQRDIGFNLRIIPRDADYEEYLLRGYASATMPYEVVEKLASRKTIAYNHLVATLQQPIQLGGKTAIVTGVSETMFPVGSKKPPMMSAIPLGKVQVGSVIADRLNWKAGDIVELFQESFEVKSIVAPTGGPDDLRVWFNLEDAQRGLEQQGIISEIRAIDCLCLEPEDDPLVKLQDEIGAVTPEAQVVMMHNIANARARQRQMMEKIAAVALPTAAMTAALGVAALGFYNVRQRRHEFAVLHALGKGKAMAGGLILIRAFFCGLVGTTAGWAVARLACSLSTEDLFPATGTAASINVAELGFTIAIVIGFCLAASLGPVMIATAQSPHTALRDE